MVFFGNDKALQSRIDMAVKIVEKMSLGDFSSHIDTSPTDAVTPLMRALKNSLATQERRISLSGAHRPGRNPGKNHRRLSN